MSDQWKTMPLSSRVAVRYGPFPDGLYWDIVSRALEEHPDPEPPTKEIQTVTGPETVEDLDNPEYQRELKAARNLRYASLGEAALEMCVEPEGDWEPIVLRIAKKWAKDPPPEDPLDRKVWFLTKYALRTRKDWGGLVGAITNFSQIEDEEVRQRVEFFRGDVAGAESDVPDAPGPADQQRLALHRAGQGPDGRPVGEPAGRVRRAAEMEED